MTAVRSIGLAAVGAVIATALFGSSSAAATVLCQEAPSAGICLAGKRYPAEQVIQASAEKPLFVTSGEDVTCETSKITLKGTTAGGPTEAVKGTVSTQTFEGCKLTGGISCTVESVNLSYLSEVNWTSGSNGTLAIKNNGGGEPGQAVSCSGGSIACVFSAESSLVVEGGNPASLSASKVSMKPSEKTGFNKCPKEVSWTAAYKTTSPSAVYVAKEVGPASVLCKEAPNKENACPEGKMYPANQEITGQILQLVLKNSIDTIKCAKSTFKIAGKTLGSGTEPATGQVQSLVFFECKTTTFGAPCTLEAIHLPYATQFNWLSGSSGTLAFAKSGESGEPQIAGKCPFGLMACLFSFEQLATFQGGSANFTLPETQLKSSKAVGFENCPKEASWEKALYKVLTPEPFLYLAAK